MLIISWYELIQQWLLGLDSKNMINSNEITKVGKIKDAHGLKGELYFLSFSGEISWLENLAEVFLENKADTVPAFIRYNLLKFKEFKDGAIIQLAGIDDRTMAEKLKGCSLYIPNEQLISDKGETIYLTEIINFTVYDSTKKQLGVIEGFSSNGAQDILVIKKDDFTYEVPFVDDFIVEIKYQEKIIIMNFPESLMDINRDNES